MSGSTARQAKAGRADTELFENVACPFCGMLCDDLEVERRGDTLKVRKNGCEKSVAGFERKLPAASPMVGGKDVALPAAIKQAAALIGHAKLPLFGGLATDVAGIRAVMALAERARGVVDHASSDAQYRNLRILQTTGWTMSTLTETRNRADLMIMVGSDLLGLHPRFFERIASPAESMFDKGRPKRTLVFIGEVPESVAKLGKKAGKVITLPCEAEQAGEVLAALRARLRGFKVKKLNLGGITLDDIDALAKRCRDAKYGVVVWAPPGLDFPYAELTVEQITGLVKDLNQTTRFAGLSLGGSEGAMTAASVSTWQSGYPLRISYAKGHPDYDPQLHSIGRILADGEGDLLVWIASFSPELAPPKTKLPMVVLGTPGMSLARPPEVFIPVGTPGVDHAGRLIRCDSVVSLPLRNLGRSGLPNVADVLAKIEAAL
jgi:formylmethanofuran dehydrogenase subunit B